VGVALEEGRSGGILAWIGGGRAGGVVPQGNKSWGKLWCGVVWCGVV